jgi:hypothetical protein
MSTITWGTTRDGDQTICAVLCYACREVFGRGMKVSEAREMKTDIDDRGHVCGADDYLPCPLCGSTKLSENLWSLDDGEVDAVECGDCFAGAPVTAWQNRQPADNQTGSQ